MTAFRFECLSMADKQSDPISLNTISRDFACNANNLKANTGEQFENGRTREALSEKRHLTCD